MMIRGLEFGIRDAGFGAIILFIGPICRPGWKRRIGERHPCFSLSSGKFVCILPLRGGIVK
jgi:hypothetical protein